MILAVSEGLIWGAAICLALLFGLSLLCVYLGCKRIVKEYAQIQKEHDEKLKSDIIAEIKGEKSKEN